MQELKQISTAEGSARRAILEGDAQRALAATDPKVFPLKRQYAVSEVTVQSGVCTNARCCVLGSPRYLPMIGTFKQLC